MASKTTRINPPVGYQGGKRRLVARLRPLIPVESMSCYIEPFVGMGAVYLDVRAHGYSGWSKIADSHPQVRDYWMLLHHAPDALIQACTDLSDRARTAESYYAMKEELADEIVERTARFLWLLNFAFGNVPPIYTGAGWRGPGTKLTSAAKWNKTFPWDDCVERLRAAAVCVAGSPTLVLDDGSALLAAATPQDFVYADPPYKGTAGYSGSVLSDYVEAIKNTRASVVLSESSELAVELAGWVAHDGDVVARLSGGTGAEGKRREFIYTRDHL